MWCTVALPAVGQEGITHLVVSQCICPEIISHTTGLLSLIFLVTFRTVCSRAFLGCSDSQFLQRQVLTALFYTLIDCWVTPHSSKLANGPQLLQTGILLPLGTVYIMVLLLLMNSFVFWNLHTVFILQWRHSLLCTPTCPHARLVEICTLPSALFVDSQMWLSIIK